MVKVIVGSSDNRTGVGATWTEARTGPRSTSVRTSLADCEVGRGDEDVGTGLHPARITNKVISQVAVIETAKRIIDVYPSCTVALAARQPTWRTGHGLRVCHRLRQCAL